MIRFISCILSGLISIGHITSDVNFDILVKVVSSRLLLESYFFDFVVNNRFVKRYFETI